MVEFPAVICHHQLSNERFTVMATERNGKIIDAAPLIRKFVGQPMQNLIAWMNSISPTDVTLLSIEADTAKQRNPYT
jgi:hypothetical protein